MTPSTKRVRAVFWSSEVLLAAFCVVALVALKGELGSVASRLGLVVSVGLPGVALIAFRQRIAVYVMRIGSASRLRVVQYFWQCTQEKDVRFFYSFSGVALIIMAGALLWLP